MSTITLTIAGRRYKLACAQGEEEHIAALGRSIDARLTAQPGLSRQSETQTLLYAALLLADELHSQPAPPAPPPPPPADADAGAIAGQSVEQLEKLAQKLETIAAALEGGPQSA